MVITFKEKTKSKIYFGDLSTGECFKLEKTPSIFMKIEDVNLSSHNSIFNAVYLDDGTVAHFDLCDEIEKVLVETTVYVEP